MSTISVIIPTCNRNDLLARCLDKLTPGVQTLAAEEYEVIVTDDGKTKTAGPMILARFPWVRWVKGPGLGPAANRNNGVRYARGEWLAFTDDDCVPDAGWLSAFRNVTQLATVLEGRTTCKAGIPDVLHEAPINLVGGRLWSCNFAIRRHLFESLGGFDECFPHPHFEDIDLHKRIELAGYRIQYLPDALVDHPPRRRRLWCSGARQWQSRVYFEHKYQRHVPCARWLPGHVLKVRLSQAMDKSWRVKAQTLAILSAIFEAGYVLAKCRRWDDIQFKSCGKDG